LSFIDFQHLPPPLCSSRDAWQDEQNKDSFMAPQTYLWPTYFYGQQKIYYFDLSRTIA
jgi:hypothetical protein